MSKLFDFFIKHFAIIVKVILAGIAYYSFRENGISNYKVLFLFPLVNLIWIFSYRAYQSYFLNYTSKKRGFIITLDIFYVLIFIFAILLKTSYILFIDLGLLVTEFLIMFKIEKKINANKKIKNVIAFVIIMNIGLLFSSGMFYLENYKYLFYIYNMFFVIFMLILSIGVLILINFKSEENNQISYKKKIIVYILYTIALVLLIGGLKIKYSNHEMTGISMNGGIFYYLIFGVYPLTVFRFHCYFADNDYIKNQKKENESL